MIHVGITRKGDGKNKFTSYFGKHGKLSKNKFWEFECYYIGWFWIEFELELLLRGRDHAGPKFTIGLFGYTIQFQIYDNRHWDAETNDWEVYED